MGGTPLHTMLAMQVVGERLLNKFHETRVGADDCVTLRARSHINKDK